MSSEISRVLAPLVKRADEIQAHHPLMAYYCACPSSRATERLFDSRHVNMVASLPTVTPSNPRARRTADPRAFVTPSRDTLKAACARLS